MDLLFIPALPLFSFAILIFFGRRLGKFSAAVSLLALAGSFFFSVRSFQLVAHHVSPRVYWNWFPFGGGTFEMGLLADPLSATMCLVVTGIGWLIMLYSVGTMASDPRFSRFFAYLSLFFFAMLTLVLADNLLLLYIGWELVGLCSYLLISFWFEKESAANAGKKAFLTTRVGDLGLLAGILLIAKLTGDLSFNDLTAQAAALGRWAPVAALLIFWGAVGKSAQFPLHVWLPDAMEGPTPVSALIHAATMVAAGVYLVARTLPLFLPSPDALLAVAAIGGITSFFAATIACTQTDLKRILAYSTISQLGLMMMGLGTGSAFAGMFHLVTHAWFKALLFLGAGSVIHAVGHQEITRMGGLGKAMPVTFWTFLAGAISMAGLPFTSGYYSKEEILMNLAQWNHPAFPRGGTFFLFLGCLIAWMTAFYISRAVFLAFLVKPKDSHRHPHESPPVMTLPLIALSLGAIGIGFVGTPLAGNAFQHFLGMGAHAHPVAWLPPTVGTIALSAIGWAYFRYIREWKPLPGFFAPVYRLVLNKYYVDELYDQLLIQPTLSLSRKAFSFDGKVIDGAVNQTGAGGLALSRLKGWFDQVVVDGLVNGVGLTFGRAGAALRLVQTGLVQNYLLVALAGGIAIFLLIVRGFP